MNYKNTFWLVLTLVALACAGCSNTGNSGTGNSQTEIAKPPPQVRVEALPSPTATLALPTDVPTATLEPTATLAEVYYWPTPDEEAIINEIDTMIDQINQKLNKDDFILKP